MLLERVGGEWVGWSQTNRVAADGWGVVVGERACCLCGEWAGCCRWWVVNRKVVGDGWW